MKAAPTIGARLLRVTGVVQGVGFRPFVYKLATRHALVGWVRKEIGPIASPDVIQFAPGLPKTRSGKIMRRLLRDIAEGKVLGDTTTLADPAVVAEALAVMGERHGHAV